MPNENANESGAVAETKPKKSRRGAAPKRRPGRGSAPAAAEPPAIQPVESDAAVAPPAPADAPVEIAEPEVIAAAVDDEGEGPDEVATPEEREIIREMLSSKAGIEEPAPAPAVKRRLSGQEARDLLRQQRRERRLAERGY